MNLGLKKPLSNVWFALRLCLHYATEIWTISTLRHIAKGLNNLNVVIQKNGKKSARQRKSVTRKLRKESSSIQSNVVVLGHGVLFFCETYNKGKVI